MRPRRVPWLRSLVVASALLVVSCDGGTAPSGETASATEPGTAATTPGATRTTPAGMTFGPATAPVDHQAARAVAVSVQAWDGGTGMDWVVLDFRPEAPACVGEYVEPPVRDAVSGSTVPVAGEAFLQVRCPGVVASQLTTEDPRGVPPRFDTQGGRYRVPGGTARNVLEVVQSGYDGQTLTWTIGLRQRAPMGIGLLGERPLQGAAVVILQ